MYHDSTIGNAVNIVLVRIMFLAEEEVSKYAISFFSIKLVVIDRVSVYWSLVRSMMINPCISWCSIHTPKYVCLPDCSLVEMLCWPASFWHLIIPFNVLVQFTAEPTDYHMNSYCYHLYPACLYLTPVPMTQNVALKSTNAIGKIVQQTVDETTFPYLDLHADITICLCVVVASIQLPGILQSHVAVYI